MNAPVTIPDEARPRLPRGVRLRHDETRGEWLLLAPERVIKPNPIAVEILKRCTGDAALSDIVDDLSKTFSADRTRVDSDVRSLIGDLAQKRLLDL